MTMINNQSTLYPAIWTFTFHEKLQRFRPYIKKSMSQMMKSCRRRMQNGKSLQQPLCAMKSRCTYQISMSSIKRAGSMDSNQHRHASIKKKIMQHSATKTWMMLSFCCFFIRKPFKSHFYPNPRKKNIIVCISYQKILI